MRQPVMRERLSKMGAAVFALALLANGATAQDETLYPELPNFHQVNSQLYRGAQPRAGGIRKLAQLGIKTIINLRGEDEDTRADQTEAEALGLRYLAVSLPRLQRPSDEQVERVLSAINAAGNHPVFVHCHHGEDRTGLIVAVYRIMHDGWTGEQAKAEAKRYGMHWVQRGMKDYILDYYRDRKGQHKIVWIKE